MEIVYQPCFDPELESLIERIHPPRVCIDNDADPGCTLVKVDSANKNGILLEMVQVLADLDLIISKSYISSDGGWFMDVFHVTDQLGNKLTDPNLLLYIQQALCASRKGGITKEIQRNLRREAQDRHVSTEHTAVEMTCVNRPGLLSEITAVITAMGCHVTAAMAWTHHDRAAIIIYLGDGPELGLHSLSLIKEEVEHVLEAHHGPEERRSVTVAAARPVERSGCGGGWTYTERRLHELMFDDGDYEQCRGCGGGGGCGSLLRQRRRSGGCGKTHVSIEMRGEKGYSVVNIRSRDRPKLLFDTVCTLTELQYVVSHAAVGSEGTMANQEYFIRQKNGCTLNSETQRNRLRQCLIAAVERRPSRGVRVDVRTRDRPGLLSDITRAIRENGLSISRAEICVLGAAGEEPLAVGTFYVTNASSSLTGQDEPDQKAVEALVREIGGSERDINEAGGDKGKLSIGSLLWAQLERLSSNFTSIRS